MVTARCCSGRATSSRSRRTRCTGSPPATKVRSSPSSRRAAATRPTCSPTRGSGGSCVDRSDYTRIAHLGMPIMNPIPASKLDEVVSLLELPARGRVVDLGCGKGDLLARIAARYEVDAVGIDRDAKLLAEAPPGINVIVADIETWNRGRGAFHLVASVGSPAQLASLAGLVRPGGLVLYGDGYWRVQPSSSYLHALGATREELADYAGTIQRGTDLGLTPLYAVTASVVDFDRYEWTW